MRKSDASPTALFTTEQRAAIRDTLNGIRSRLPRRVLIRYEVHNRHHYARIEHCPAGGDFGPMPRWPLVSVVSRGGAPAVYRVLGAPSGAADFMTFPEALRAAKVTLLRVKAASADAAPSHESTGG